MGIATVDSRMDTEPAEFDLLGIGSESGLDVAGAAPAGVSRSQSSKGTARWHLPQPGLYPLEKSLYHAEVMETVERAAEFGFHNAYWCHPIRRN